MSCCCNASVDTAKEGAGDGALSALLAWAVTWVDCTDPVLGVLGLAVAGQNGALLCANHELGGASLGGEIQRHCSQHRLSTPLL